MSYLASIYDHMCHIPLLSCYGQSVLHSDNGTCLVLALNGNEGAWVRNKPLLSGRSRCRLFNRNQLVLRAGGCEHSKR